MQTQEQEKQVQEEEAQARVERKKVTDEKFAVCRKFTKAADTLMLITGGLSILFAFPISNLLPRGLFTGFVLISILLLLGQFATQVAADVHFYPDAERAKVLGMFYDAFDKRLLNQDKKEYYNNAEEAGVDRLLADCFQSCLYTLRIAKKKTAGLVIKNAILFCVFLVAARIGMENQLYLASLQIFLSPLYLWALCKHFYFVHCVQRVFDGFEYMFTLPQKKKLPAVLRHLVIYEKTLSDYGTMLDPSSKIYHQLGSILEKEWNIIKNEHGIR